MGYARQSGETTEQYVDRIRSEAANNTISSGPGGSMVQSAIDAARGYGPGSGGKPANQSASVSNNYFAANNNSGGNAANPIYSAITPALNPATTKAANIPANPTGANPVAETNSTAPSGASPLGMDPNLVDNARRGILYNLSDPEFALQNALTDRGIGTMNPLIARGVLPAARGLASAFTLKGAQDPNAGPGYDVASHFKDFLGGVLGGAGGGIQNVMGSAMHTLQSPELSNSLNNASSLSAAGTAPQNPFLAGLLGMLSDPTAIAGIQGSLSLPLLGNQLSQALQQLQQVNISRAYRNVNSTANNSFLEYLMGR